MKKYIITSVIGGAVGYLYYKTIGCNNGTCLISSTSQGSIIYGTIMANLLVLLK